MGNCCGGSGSKTIDYYEVAADTDNDDVNLTTSATYGDMLKPIADPSAHRDFDNQSATTFADTPEKYMFSESSPRASVSKKDLWKNEDEIVMEGEFHIKVPIRDDKRTK